MLCRILQLYIPGVIIKKILLLAIHRKTEARYKCIDVLAMCDNIHMITGVNGNIEIGRKTKLTVSQLYSRILV